MTNEEWIRAFRERFTETTRYHLLSDVPVGVLLSGGLGTDHHEVEITAKNFVDMLPAYIWHMDEPVADPASVPLFAVSQLASQHVRVVLSGEGSDELLGGYFSPTQFKAYNRFRLFKKLPSPLRERVLESLNRHLFQPEKLERYLEMARHPISSYGAMVPAFQDCVFTEAIAPFIYTLF